MCWRLRCWWCWLSEWKVSRCTSDLWLGGCLQMPQSRKTLSSFILQSFGLGRGGLGATLAYDVLGAA